MILSMGFFAYAWEGDYHVIAPIRPGGYLVEVANRVIHFPVWLNMTLFFIVNGIIWAAVVFVLWLAVARLLVRDSGRAA